MTIKNCILRATLSNLAIQRGAAVLIIGTVLFTFTDAWSRPFLTEGDSNLPSCGDAPPCTLPSYIQDKECIAVQGKIGEGVIKMRWKESKNEFNKCVTDE